MTANHTMYGWVTPVPEVPGDEGESLVLSKKVNEVARGKLNAGGTFDAEAATSSSAVTDPRVHPKSVVLLVPMNQLAANILWYVSTVGEGTFTVTHQDPITGDATFRYVVIS